jgi:hypothetical protein
MHSPHHDISAAIQEAGNRIFSALKRRMRVGRKFKPNIATTQMNAVPQIPEGIGAGALFRYLFTCRYPGRRK